MKASPIQLSKFLQRQDTQFVIPIYQRNYDWTEEQCSQLLDDILEVGKLSKEAAKVHFIGSIVYVCNDEYTTDEIEEFVVIDGQQRITTVTLLLIALYHYEKKHNNTKLAETIYEYYLINKNAEDEAFKLKLKATENNEQELIKLIEKITINNTDYSNIKNNFNFFYKNINEYNHSLIYEGFKRLLFVEIRLERGKDNAQKIFESLNSTGLDLSQADLIRNYILMDLEPSEQKNLFQKFWSIIELNTRYLGESYLSDFIRDFLTIKTGEISNKNKVYTRFKKEYDFKSKQELVSLLTELKKYSEIYKYFIDPSVMSDKDIQRELQYIKYIEINVSYPFLLQVFDDFNKELITKQTIINVLMFVQTYACRRFVIDLPTNALSRVFMNLHKQINLNNYEQSLYKNILTRNGKARMPSDNEIKNYLADKDLYNAKSKMKLYILERLENYENKEKVQIIGNSNITIEHIFPQNPDKQWHTQLSDIEFNEFYDKFLHTIGNLTLSGNNGSLGNKIFSEKKNMNINDGEQGYIYSRLWLNRYLQNIDCWNTETYIKRTHELINRFLNIWYIPESIIEHNDIPEININDIDPNFVTNKDIEYAVFFDKTISGEEYKGIKLYNYILKEIFKLYPEEFISKLRGLVKLTENQEELLRPYELNSTYFIENNLSYYQIISNLKKITDLLNLNEKLFIKIKDKNSLLK